MSWAQKLPAELCLSWVLSWIEENSFSPVCKKLFLLLLRHIIWQQLLVWEDVFIFTICHSWAMSLCVDTCERIWYSASFCFTCIFTVKNWFVPTEGCSTVSFSFYMNFAKCSCILLKKMLPPLLLSEEYFHVTFGYFSWAVVMLHINLLPRAVLHGIWNSETCLYSSSVKLMTPFFLKIHFSLFFQAKLLMPL